MFGTVKLTKNADIDKYKYSGYVIGFDRRVIFSFATGAFGSNVIIFVVDMNSSVHVDSRNFYSWLRPYTRIRWYNIDCRKKYSINLTESRKKKLKFAS